MNATLYDCMQIEIDLAYNILSDLILPKNLTIKLITIIYCDKINTIILIMVTQVELSFT